MKGGDAEAGVVVAPVEAENGHSQEYFYNHMWNHMAQCLLGPTARHMPSAVRASDWCTSCPEQLLGTLKPTVCKRTERTTPRETDDFGSDSDQIVKQCLSNSAQNAALAILLLTCPALMHGQMEAVHPRFQRFRFRIYSL